MAGSYGQYITIALSLYCVFHGVRTLLTGTAMPGEEMRIKDFTERAAKRYRLVSAITNILAGILLAVLSVVKLTNPDMDTKVFTIVLLAIVVLLLVVYVVNWQICKKDK